MGHLWRLLRAGIILARHGGLMTREQAAALPWHARLALGFARLVPAQPGTLNAALAGLGPSYIKLGQFLATRPDLIGPARAAELRALQDRLPPFPLEEARRVVETELGDSPANSRWNFHPVSAAASIAQVHRVTTPDGREVAMKILRPGIEARFARDLGDFHFAARWLETLSVEARRLRPAAAVATLAHSVKLELDLRMEAAAIAEMAENTKDDEYFRVPSVIWPLTARRVLTTEWIDATPLSDLDALKVTGIDLNALADAIIQNFLKHAIRDGFFHADMHPGNLFAGRDGRLVAVDFGIMGRLTPKERLFLAEILYGFITRNYLRVAQVHFDAGYVPQYQDVATFAQALRAIGEPIMDRPAHEISMARLLTQLFEVTGQFDMETQPQLLLLQKTMVVVEGVARMLNPNFNMWVAAEPVVGQWLSRELGPIGRLEAAAEGASRLFRLLAALPDTLSKAEQRPEQAPEQGAVFSEHGPERRAERDALVRHARITCYAAVTGAVALVVIALALIW